MKRSLCVSLAVVALLAVVFADTAKAADFTPWTHIWVKATLAESGLTAPAFPTGGKVTSVREKDAVLYLKFVSCDAILGACNVSVCTLNATTNTYSLQTGFAAPLIGGNPLDFLTYLVFGYQEATGVTESLTLPLRVRATTTGSALRTVSLTSIGGAFMETPEDGSSGEIGTATLKATSLVSSASVPTPCQP
jgi:hypothetical protein